MTPLPQQAIDQLIFACSGGSAAAPTLGLYHFHWLEFPQINPGQGATSTSAYRDVAWVGLFVILSIIQR